MTDEALFDRAWKAGLLVDWMDATGRSRRVNPDTLRAVLDVLGDTNGADEDLDGNERCFAIEEAGQGRKLAGLAVQLYALRGTGGFGDLRALRAFISEAAAQGIDGVAISPVHAPFLAAPGECSPYAPSSRLFLNPLFADTGEWPDDGASGLIDWPKAAREKLSALRRVFDAASPAAAMPDRRLRDHARFEALDAYFRRQGLNRWQDWPAAYRDPQSAAVEEFAREHAQEVAFHGFVQDLTEHSLAAAQAQARATGMAIGLIADLAVGMSPHGSHAWSAPDEVLRGLTIGAPPDIFNTQGQDWGLTALSPHKGHEAFARTLDVAMRHVGGVRIDHAMGLRRLWVIPEGARPDEGVYLRYPFDRLMGIVARESRRHRAIIIGEDLGTVPDGFRDALRARGIMGMEVLWFQRDGRRFLDPARWRRDAAALSTTHDLPTLAGWWTGHDIEWLERLARHSEHGDAAAERRARDEDRAHLWSVIGAGDMPPPGEPAPVVARALEFVGGTPCALAIVELEDVLGLVEQPNIPGTIDEHPNWRRRLPPGDPFASTAAKVNLAAFLRGRKA